jgi:hypothetical protein
VPYQRRNTGTAADVEHLDLSVPTATDQVLAVVAERECPGCRPRVRHRRDHASLHVPEPDEMVPGRRRDEFAIGPVDELVATLKNLQADRDQALAVIAKIRDLVNT